MRTEMHGNEHDGLAYIKEAEEILTLFSCKFEYKENVRNCFSSKQQLREDERHQCFLKCNHSICGMEMGNLILSSLSNAMVQYTVKGCLV